MESAWHSTLGNVHNIKCWLSYVLSFQGINSNISTIVYLAFSVNLFLKKIRTNKNWFQSVENWSGVRKDEKSRGQKWLMLEPNTGIGGRFLLHCNFPLLIKVSKLVNIVHFIKVNYLIKNTAFVMKTMKSIVSVCE